MAAVAALLVAAGCSEPSAAPNSAAPLAASSRAPSFNLSASSRNISTQIVVGAQGGSFQLVGGLITVTFPANSICDPTAKGYDYSAWNTACATLSSSQTITENATVRVTASGVSLDFDQPIRFDKDAGVTISTNAFAPILVSNASYFRANPSALNVLAMYYTPKPDEQGVADWRTSSSLITHVDLRTGVISRVVWHFSGYSVTTGQSCDPSPDNPDCVASFY